MRKLLLGMIFAVIVAWPGPVRADVIPIPVYQSGTWTANRTWNLIFGSDSVAAHQGGSWTVTANAGTNLNTSALALDTTLGRAQGSATPGQTGPLAQGAVTTANPTYVTGQTSPLSLTTAGALRVTSDLGTRINCTINSIATTSTLITGCTAPGAGLSIYVISFDYSQSANATSTNFMTLQAGGGATCGTGTVVLWQGYSSANVLNAVTVGDAGLKLPPNTGLCFVNPITGTKLVNARTYVAP